MKPITFLKNIAQVVVVYLLVFRGMYTNLSYYKVRTFFVGYKALEIFTRSVWKSRLTLKPPTIWYTGQTTFIKLKPVYTYILYSKT